MKAGSVPRFPAWPWVLHGAALLAVLIFAAVWTWQCGRRGFFPFDQSIVFDGAYRIVRGQTPYKDFLIPVGPVTFWIQAVFFHLGGVNYQAYLAHSALGNCVAAGSAYCILRSLLPLARGWAYLGAILTAIWFYPPFGTPWEEQTAFLFALLALAVAVSNWPLYARACACGALMALGFLSKQNAGLFGAMPVVVVLTVPHVFAPRRIGAICLALALGAAVVFLALAAWLVLASDTNNFWRYFWTIPAEEGRRRLFDAWPRTARIVLLSDGPDRPVIAIWLSGLTSLAPLALNFNRWRRNTLHETTVTLPAGVGLACIAAQNLFLASANNNPENGYSLLGLIVALWGALTCSLLPRSADGPRLPLKPLFLAGYAVFVALIAYNGLRVGLHRDVHDFFLESRFGGHCDVPILRDVVWTEGEPMPCGDLEATVQFLAHSRSRVVVFDHFTLLHAMLDQPSPQPLVSFHPGLTFAAGYDAQVDQWIVESLDKNRVDLVVDMLRHQTFIQPHFPRAKEYLTENFRPVRTIGPFVIHQRTGIGIPPRTMKATSPSTTRRGASEGTPAGNWFQRMPYPAFLLSAALVASLVNLFFFCPRFALWRGLDLPTPRVDIDLAVDTLTQLEDPFARIENRYNRVLQWRLLFPLLGHWLHLPRRLFLALPHVGCLAALALIAHITFREFQQRLLAVLATALAAGCTWFFVSTGWLSYNDSWTILGLVAVALLRSRIVLAAAVLLCPWIDERFLLLLPVCLCCGATLSMRTNLFGRC